MGVLRGGSLQGNTQQQNAVQQAGWQCLTVLFDRIGRMLDIPGVRRDGAALVPKLVALLQQQFPAALVSYSSVAVTTLSRLGTVTVTVVYLACQLLRYGLPYVLPETRS